MDALKNFAYSLVATAPSPATSGTTLVVTAGQGTYFPATPFDATIWPAGSQPTNANAEIVRVTSVATDTFTITRAQYGTTAQSIAVGYQIAQTVDANLLNQLAPLSGATFTGEVVAPDFNASGLTGATAASRYVGGTTAGAPTSGTFAVGDFVIDHTATIWVCTIAGTPGTWSPTESQNVTLRSATATAALGEITIFSGSTASQTITLPAHPVGGSTYSIVNNASVPVNVKGGTNSLSLEGTLYGATTPYTIPVGAGYNFVFDGTGVWYNLFTTDITNLVGVLGTSNGGTGLSTIGTAGQVLTVNAGATGLQYSTPSTTPTPVYYTSNGTAAAGETSYVQGAYTVTLPTAPANGTINSITTQYAGFTATVQRGGSTDTLTIANNGGGTGSQTSVSVPQLTTRRFIYASGVWDEITGISGSQIVSSVAIAAGGTGATTASAARGTLGVVPGSVFPTAHNVKAWTYDPVTCMSSQAATLTKGAAFATRIHMTTAATVSTIGFMTATVGATVTNAYASVYNAAGAVLGYGALPSLVANTYQTVTLTAVGSLALSADTDYFIVFQVGTSTGTAPAIYSAGDSSSTSPIVYAALTNFGATNSAGTLNGRCSFWGTTLNTTPAAVGAATPTFSIVNFFATLN